jgi:transposase
MRGDDNSQEGIFSYISPEKRVPADHPLRPIRKMVDEILKEMLPQFAKLYSNVGRPSIAPERLLRSLLLQIFYSVRSERMLIEQLQYNLLFRWFVGMEMDEEVWNHAVFSKNRERLLNEEIAEGFFRRVIERAKPFMSDEHFTVDGTLIEAWASHKSFRRKDGRGKPPEAGGDVNFHGEKRKNETHASTTDPDARLFKKSKGGEAKLSYLGHVLMENRNGLLVQTFLTEANGRAEREAAMLMAEAIPGGKRVTLGGDKNYDTQEFVRELRGMNITPHVAQNDTNRSSAIDQRTTRQAGYEMSQRKRKRVEVAAIDTQISPEWGNNEASACHFGR